MFDYISYRKNFLKQRYYIELIANLKVMLDLSRSEAKDLSQERDLLRCIGCGVKEEDVFNLSYNPSEEKTKIIPPGSFILIEAKQKTIRCAGKPKKLNIYSYICPECGLYQNSLIRCK